MSVRLTIACNDHSEGVSTVIAMRDQICSRDACRQTDAPHTVHLMTAALASGCTVCEHPVVKGREVRPPLRTVASNQSVDINAVQLSRGRYMPTGGFDAFGGVTGCEVRREGGDARAFSQS